MIKFIVLGWSRSGSNWFVSGLNAHANVYCQGEILKSEAPKPFMKPRKEKALASGFKMFPYHEKLHPKLVKKILEDGDVRFIHLRRWNILRRFASKTILGLKKKVDRGLGDGEKVYLDPKKVEAAFKDTTEQDFLNRLGGHALHTVVYERLMEDFNGEMNQVWDFLQVPRQKVKSSWKKLHDRSLPDLISNYDELKRLFANGPFSCYFEED